ncbi:hypothetical protein Tsubulata_038806, partial [Turnera subulata]
MKEIQGIGTLCCNDHPAVGDCIPGVDDRWGNATVPDGKCVTFCLEGCQNGKGGYCTKAHIRQTNANDHLCCNDHSAVGKCIPGVDDWPGNSTKLPGKCFRFCFEGCRIGKGGYCKPRGQEHICHCCCIYELCHF